MIRFVTFGAASVAYSFIGDGFGKVECLGPVTPVPFSEERVLPLKEGKKEGNNIFGSTGLSI
jgi:hypothetical protein